MVGPGAVDAELSGDGTEARLRPRAGAKSRAEPAAATPLPYRIDCFAVGASLSRKGRGILALVGIEVTRANAA
jgi:hypothetical protein